jgi:hypothetical protein
VEPRARPTAARRASARSRGGRRRQQSREPLSRRARQSRGHAMRTSRTRPSSCSRGGEIRIGERTLVLRRRYVALRRRHTRIRNPSRGELVLCVSTMQGPTSSCTRLGEAGFVCGRGARGPPQELTLQVHRARQRSRLLGGRVSRAGDQCPEPGHLGMSSQRKRAPSPRGGSPMSPRAVGASHPPHRRGGSTMLELACCHRRRRPLFALTASGRRARLPDSVDTGRTVDQDTLIRATCAADSVDGRSRRSGFADTVTATASIRRHERDRRPG